MITLISLSLHSPHDTRTHTHTDRLQFFNLTGDITSRVDTMSAWMGQLFVSIGILGCQQNLVQRYLSMNSEKEIRK